MRLLLIVVCFLMVFFCVGCKSTLPPEAQARMDNYQEQVEKLNTTAEEAAIQGKLISDQLKALELQVKSGALNAPDVLVQSKALIDRAEHLTQTVIEARREIKEIITQAKVLHEQFSIPAWYTAVSTAGTVLTLITGVAPTALAPTRCHHHLGSRRSQTRGRRTHR